MARLKTKTPKARMNFGGTSLQFPQPTKERLERLREQLEADSISEVVRRALALYEALLTERQNGGETVVRYEDGSEAKLLWN